MTNTTPQKQHKSEEIFSDCESPGDKVVGVEDFGNGHRTNNLATSAIVFMAVASYLTGNSPSGII